MLTLDREEVFARRRKRTQRMDADPIASILAARKKFANPGLIGLVFGQDLDFVNRIDNDDGIPKEDIRFLANGSLI
jgi:hypothetical protein